MFNPMRSSFLAAALTATVLCSTAVGVAHATEPMRVRGSLTGVTVNELKVRTRDGKDVGIKIGADTKIASVMLTDLSAIKPDSYIGTAAAPQADGTLKALEVHIFPPSMRGVGEGSGPWDMQPNSTMTNGSVGSILGADGRTLTVKYESGEKKVFIPADVPIVSIEPADRSVLKIGAKVLLLAEKAGDESLSAFAVNVGANGIAPPM